MTTTTTTTAITEAAIDTATTSFEKSPVRQQERPDATQSAWALLLRRRTKWVNREKLRSQARNAMADAIRKIAIRQSIERTAILSALQWDQVIDHDRQPCPEPDDLESLSFGAWLHGRAHCRALVATNERNTCEEWQDLVTDRLIAEFEQSQLLPNSPADVRRAAAAVTADLLAGITAD